LERTTRSNLELDRVGVKFPIVHVVEALISALCGQYRAINTTGVADFYDVLLNGCPSGLSRFLKKLTL
jgi:hypothetical protein